jgi:putative flavoprotein involved in K+ transport
VPRTVGVKAGAPALEDGRVLDVSNVVWCTGFRPDFGWIDLPVF